jgi:peptide/nickel transport system ATP-binding protein
MTDTTEPLVPLIEIDSLDVVYRGRTRRQSFHALHDISFDILPGETVGMVGESGSGKTTIGRALLGLVPVASGRIAFDGEDITRAGARTRRRLARDIQVVFQDPYSSLNPSMTVEDILIEPLTIQGWKAADARRHVADLLERVHLPAGAGDRLPREFSGGQRQRIAIARAIALQPRLIVCDEPVSALDLTTQERVLDLLVEIQEATGVAYLFISHDLSVVRHISHQTLVLYRGELVETGTADQVTSEPHHPYTRRLLMASPVPDPIRQRERRRQRQQLREASASQIDEETTAS